MQGVKKRIKDIFGEHAYNVLVLPKHFLVALVANVRYGFPSRGMTIVGITGTNGKTTTTNMIGAVLQASGRKVGILSSAVLQTGPDAWQENPMDLTTADAMRLQAQLKKMKEAGVTHVVLEVASHAISQFRILGIAFEGAVFTNLTQDHLDYHRTMKRYAHTKRRLFKKARNFVVLNRDDQWYETMNVKQPFNTVTYGSGAEADIHVTAAQLKVTGAEFTLETPKGSLDIKLHLTGKFNVYNAMAAVGVGVEMGIELTDIARGLAELERVPGRMELVNEGQNFTVIIDHAHTPDALENLFSELKQMGKGSLIVVVGADGERDPSKRIPLGVTTAKYADYAFVTDQEPYGDNPDPIRQQVIDGLMQAGFNNFEEIARREDAFVAAFKSARAGDVVVLTGLGNQKYRGTNDGKVEWSERTVAKDMLKKAGKAK